MSLHGLLRRASSLLGGPQNNQAKQAYSDGEIVFSKNNVCVHTPSQFRREGSSIHHPGYLVVRCRHFNKHSDASECNEVTYCGHGSPSHNAELFKTEDAGNSNGATSTTLTLTWIPNEKLARNHDLISQLNPDTCRSGSISRSCSPCRLSDADSISMSSFCCYTDTPCTTSIASKSYEESSTALISSDVSSTDVPTLNVQQQENTVESIAELPVDVHDLLLESTAGTAVNSTFENNSISGNSVDDSHAHDQSLASKFAGETDGVENVPIDPTSTSSLTSNAQKYEEDSDTGVFFESGSSSDMSSELRETVAAALESSIITATNNIELADSEQEIKANVKLQAATVHSGSIDLDQIKVNSDCIADASRNTSLTACTATHSMSESHRDKSDLAVNCGAMQQAQGLWSTDTGKYYDFNNDSEVQHLDHSQTTEEGSTSGCGGEDTSFDSSPEPHVPTYGGIFPADMGDGVWFEGTAESMAYSANLAFPEWSGSVSSSWSSTVSHTGICSGALPSILYATSGGSAAAPHAVGCRCGGGNSPSLHHHTKLPIFSVDLGEMRSLRLFFSDSTGSRGQLVVASCESQYKILHFHHAGLDRLAAVFEDWNFLVPPRDNSSLLERHRRERQRRSALVEEREGDVGEHEEEREVFKQFSVCRPTVAPSELHPAEGSVKELDAEDWLAYFSPDHWLYLFIAKYDYFGAYTQYKDYCVNASHQHTRREGMIEDDLGLRRRVFLGGLEPQLRSSVWPFLLRCYPYSSTFAERQELTDRNRALYQQLTERRERMASDEREEFWRSVQFTVEKDVVRTDRSNPCFAGHDNPNLAKMKNILLNFALHYPDIGYTQGMSDILAPILSEVRCEPDVFWCFTGLMSKTIFVTSPRDLDMEKNLLYLRELLQVMVPDFYSHVSAHQDGEYLLFCHRWILLCFKREFAERSVLQLWEACWSHYQTDYFHLFLAVAVVCVYGREVTQQNMRPDETLLYFTSLAHHMDADIVIKKARGLLHQYRSLSQVPCTLAGLCEQCGPGMWDSGHQPTIVCRGHEEGQLCSADNRGETAKHGDFNEDEVERNSTFGEA